MSDLSNLDLIAWWQKYRPEIEKVVREAFVRHAIDNRGLLTSTRRGSQVAEQIYNLVGRFLMNESNHFEITAVTESLVNEGLAMVTGSAMMRALGQIKWVETADPHILSTALERLNQFQVLFLENLADAREMHLLRTQESSQLALQHALHKQLDQQRQIRLAQELQNKILNDILSLNARLTQATNDRDLLDEAVSGICRALNLGYVTFYEWFAADEDWVLRTTTGEMSGPLIDLITRERLEQARTGEGEIIESYQTADDQKVMIMTVSLQVGKEVMGAMVADSGLTPTIPAEELPIFLRTFAQNLAALWRNLALLAETRQHARELEVLYGRYMDSIWQTDTATLQVSYSHTGLETHTAFSPSLTAPENGHTLPLMIGESAFGRVHLPNASLNDEDTEFAQAIVREMASAINNAHLVQTTRSFSNQLSLAAEVSRAVTTLLDRNLLIQEVVELIQARFNYYYVGLFLVDERGETAVLQAGTGEAGRLQVAQKHHHVLSGSSMISAAIRKEQAHIEQDVTQASVFSFNPLLPETRAEAAIPLRARGQPIGALTVQSTQQGAFSSETITVLQNLADQVAIAIVNAGLFARVQHNLEETSRLYEAGRKISEAADARSVYQAMVEFAAKSDLVDFAQIIITDPKDPESLISPAIWSSLPYIPTPQQHFPHAYLPFSEQLSKNEVVFLANPPSPSNGEAASNRLMQEVGVQSSAFIPIFTEGEWLGTFVLHAINQDTLTEHTLQPFRTLADAAAVTLSNQQLLKQTEVLYQIGRSLSQTITREDALDIAVREVAEYTGATQCRIILYDKQTGIGTIAAEAPPTSLVDNIRLPMLGDYVYEYLDERRQSLVLEEDSLKVPLEALRYHLNQFHAKASILIPAASQQELIGYLALDSKQYPLPFSKTNIIFAQTVIDHLTTQLENIKLLEEAHNRAQELITLNQIQSNISGILDLSRLARVIYDEVGRLLDNTVFIVGRYEPQTSGCTPILVVVEGQTVTMHSRTVQANEPLYHFLYGGLAVLANPSTPLMQAEAIPGLLQMPQSSLWVPLQQENRPSGWMCVQSYEPRAYSENDTQLLRSIATQTGLALENARLFEQIQANLAELQELDQLKTQFLANMSHELRTPLNSIIGFSRVILKGIDGPITKEQQEDLTSIFNNGQHLLNLINEILDMAKIEAGKMTLLFELVQMEDMVKHALSTIRSLLKEGVALTWEIAPHLPLVEADPMRIRQILINLLSNAAKYTYQGSIHLLVDQQDEENIHIAVKDTGIGIAHKDYDKLFKAFEQVDSSTTRTEGGTGLGLPITQSLVKMHQGNIWFESEVGKGSTFHVTLPISQENHAVTD